MSWTAGGFPLAREAQPNGLVSYDYSCDICGEEASRTIPRKDKDSQICDKGHWMTRLFPSPKQYGTQYPLKIVTMKGEPVATSPSHYKRLLKESGYVVAGGAKRGWT